MKKSIKFSAIILALIIMAISVFSGCGNGEQAAKKIGIIQFMPHSSLDNCCQGIKNILDKNNIAYEVQIGSSTSPTEDCQSYAARMASDGQYDMIIAIATPAATAAYSAVRNASSDIPVIFCAVSDPVAAKLVESTDKPGNNCTGTSDAFDIPSQVKMIKAFQPDLAKLGVIYTTTEPNSLSQLETLKSEAAKFGIEIVEKGINDATELPTVTANLLPEVQAVTNLTDNNVVENMSTLLEQANTAGIPVYGSEIEQVKKGCIAAASLDYVALGEKTAEMALGVRSENNAAQTPVLVITDSTPVINTQVMAKFNITLPEAYNNAEKVTAETA